MILKSYEIENNISLIVKYRAVLFYGENIGLKDTLKKKIIDLNKGAEIINLYQEDISKNKDVITKEINSNSLFTTEKIIIVNQANEKIIDEIENFSEDNKSVKVILFAEKLDKRSKLRSLFEKDKSLAVIPCYNDNDITLRKLVGTELKEFKNLNNNYINMIINYSNLNRKTILNNIDKIKIYFDKKVLEEKSLETILNSDRNELFENIRDAALEGNKIRLNNLFENFIFANEDAYLYLNSINYRLIKMLDILKQKESGCTVEEALSSIKPPIFWKDKPIYLRLLKRWDIEKIIRATSFLGKIEKNIKNNSGLNQLTIVKNSIINICSNSWVYF